MNTNTQKLVFSKITNPNKSLKKQDLGAIEDAVEQVKQDLYDKTKYMEGLVNDLNTQRQEIQSKALALAEDLSNSLIEAGSLFNQAEQEYLDIAKELDALGIQYDSIYPDIGSDFRDAYDVADTLMFNLGN